MLHSGKLAMCVGCSLRRNVKQFVSGPVWQRSWGMWEFLEVSPSFGMLVDCFKTRVVRF